MTSLCLALAFSGTVFQPGDAWRDDSRAAAARGLAAIEKSVQEYPKHRHCFSCHHQAVPALALHLARSRGFAVDESSFEAIDLVATADLQLAEHRYRKGWGQGGGATRAGYALWALELTDHPPDETTRAVAKFLIATMQPGGAWRTSSNRPPSEASWLTTTAVALQGLESVPNAEEPAQRADRLNHVRAWLRHVPVKDTEDAVFRLWGLSSTAADAATRKQAAQLLIELQNPDGGWSQTPEMPSDAYATGSVLVSLARAGEVDTQHPAFQRGIVWLRAHQAADGTWHVQSRSKPFQPYFESGFPYGPDQFISIAASAWSTAALVLASDVAP